MPKVDVKSIDGQVIGQVELPENVFGVPYNPYPVQEVVRMQMANRRRGTQKAKGRSEIAGTTKKHHRQKGTGFARAGSVKSPIRRGGGVVFPPTPRDYSFFPPKKVRKAALKIVLSKKLEDGDMDIIREFDVETPKTKAILEKLDSEKTKTSTLVIMNETFENLIKSLANVPNYKTLKTEGLNVYDVMKYKRLILLEKSIPIIIKRLGE